MNSLEPEPRLIEDIRAELTRTVPQLQQHGSPWTSVDEALDWWIRLYRLTGNERTVSEASKPMECGKCGRRLGTAYASAPNGLPQAVPVTDDHLGLPRQATGHGRGVRDASLPGALAQERWEVSCHRRCGTRHVLTGKALLKAFVVTGERGRRSIIIGVGHHAAARGGSDL